MPIFFDYHFVDLNEMVIKDEYVRIIPELVARSQRVVVFGIEDGVLWLATENLNNYEFFRLLEKKTQKEIAVFYATQAGINKALKYYKGDLHNKIKELIDDEATFYGAACF